MAINTARGGKPARGTGGRLGGKLVRPPAPRRAPPPPPPQKNPAQHRWLHRRWGIVASVSGMCMRQRPKGAGCGHGTVCHAMGKWGRGRRVAWQSVSRPASGKACFVAAIRDGARPDRSGQKGNRSSISIAKREKTSSGGAVAGGIARPDVLQSVPGSRSGAQTEPRTFRRGWPGDLPTELGTQRRHVGRRPGRRGPGERRDQFRRCRRRRQNVC